MGPISIVVKQNNDVYKNFKRSTEFCSLKDIGPYTITHLESDKSISSDLRIKMLAQKYYIYYIIDLLERIFYHSY